MSDLFQIDDINDRDRADRLLGRAHEEFREGNLETAAAMFAEAADAFADWGDLSAQTRALAMRGSALFNCRDYEGGAEAYRAAALVAGSAGDASAQAHALWGLADCQARLGRWTEVLEHTSAALATIRDFEYEELHARTLLLRARAQYFLHDERESLETCWEAREAFKAERNPAGLRDANDFTVTVLLELNRNEEALALASRNLALCEGTAERPQRAYAQRRLGETNFWAGRADAALALFGSARKDYVDENLHGPAAICDFWAARAHRSSGRFDAAVALQRTAVQVFDALRWTSWLDEAQQELAELLFCTGQATDAREITAGLVEDASAENEGLSAGILGLAMKSVVTACRDGHYHEAMHVLGLVESAHAQDASALAVVAARCWINWNTDRRFEALSSAMNALSEPGMTEVGLPQALILEVCGAGREPKPASLIQLSRAQAIYLELGETQRAEAVAKLVLEVSRKTGFQA